MPRLRTYQETGGPATVTIASQHSAPLRQSAFIDVAVHDEADPQVVYEIAEKSLATSDHVALALDGWLIPR